MILKRIYFYSLEAIFFFLFSSGSFASVKIDCFEGNCFVGVSDNKSNFESAKSLFKVLSRDPLPEPEKEEKRVFSTDEGDLSIMCQAGTGYQNKTFIQCLFVINEKENVKLREINGKKMLSVILSKKTSEKLYNQLQVEESSVEGQKAKAFGAPPVDHDIFITCSKEIINYMNDYHCLLIARTTDL